MKHKLSTGYELSTASLKKREGEKRNPPLPPYREKGKGIKAGDRPSEAAILGTNKAGGQTLRSGDLGHEIVEVVDFVPNSLHPNLGTKFVQWLISCPKYDIILPVKRRYCNVRWQKRHFGQVRCSLAEVCFLACYGAW